MQLSVVGAPQLALELKQVEPAGAPSPGIVVASARSRSAAAELPLSIPMNVPPVAAGAARKPDPSGETAAPLLKVAFALPKPSAHHWMEDTAPPPGTGANQVPLAH